MLGFLLASFGFVEFFYILLERSQEIHQHMVFLLSPIIRSMTVVNTVAAYTSVCPHIYIYMSKMDAYNFVLHRAVKSLYPLLTLRDTRKIKGGEATSCQLINSFFKIGSGLNQLMQAFPHLLYLNITKNVHRVWTIKQTAKPHFNETTDWMWY